MAWNWTEGGLAYGVIQWAKNGGGDPPWEMGLYVNDVDIDIDTTIGDLVLASFTGSDPIEILTSGWDTFYRISDRVAMDYLTALEWDNTGGSGQTVYGVALLNTVDGGLFAGEKFAVPVDMTPGSSLILNWTLYTKNDPSPP